MPLVTVRALPCRVFALRCLAILASTLKAAMWKQCDVDASVLVVQLSETLRSCTDPQQAEHGIAALQAVGEAAVEAGVISVPDSSIPSEHTLHSRTAACQHPHHMQGTAQSQQSVSAQWGQYHRSGSEAALTTGRSGRMESTPSPRPLGSCLSSCQPQSRGSPVQHRL